MEEVEGSKTQGDFVVLPNELTVQVFSSLDTNDLLSVSQACKHWNTLSEDDSLWKPLYKKRWAAPPPPPKYVYKPAGTSGATSGESATPTGPSDEDEIRGWRSWKNKYTTKINWLNGQVIYKTSIDVGHKKPLCALQLSDAYYYTAGEDATVRITDVATGEHVGVLQGHQSTVTCMQVDTDRRRTAERELVVTGSKDTTLKIWKNRECVRTLRGHHGKISHLQFDVEANKLVTRGWDLNANVWDLETGQLISTRRTNSVCTSFQFKRSQMVCGYLDNQIKVWDLRTGQVSRHFGGHNDSVTSIQFDENFIVSGSNDKTVRIWELRSGRMSASLSAKARVQSVQFSGTKLASAGDDKKVKIWNMKTRQELYELAGPTAPIKKLRFDDKKVVCVGNDSRVHIWNFAERMAY